MDLIRSIGKTFLYVIAGITLSATTFITVFIPKAILSVSLLWQIIIMAAICSCGNIIYFSKKELTKRSMRLRKILHYLFINIANIVGAYYWVWIKPGYLPHIIVMLLLIAAVYIVTMLLNFGEEKRIASKLNQALLKYHTDEGEE